MDKFINDTPLLLPYIATRGVEMKKVLIATLYKPEPVLLASNRLGPDRLILLLDKEPNKEQEASFKLIKESLGKVIDVKAAKTEVYDIVAIARQCVEIIDMQPSEDHIYINITSGRKTKAFGVLLGAYARADKVKKIAYNPEDMKTVVYLPKLSFKLNESQKKVLEVVEKHTSLSLAEMAEKSSLSPAMFYRSVNELRDMDLLITEPEISLTDAGRIARL